MPVVNVMMFGGRRCGKTSVLAAMQSCFEREFNSTNLSIVTADNNTLTTLEEKHREIEDYFNNSGHREFQPDDNPSQGISEHKFKIGLRNRRTDSIIVNFIDYPGEWISDAEHADELTNIMSKSHIIIIATDSPHLMEAIPEGNENGVGRFNDRRNYCYRIGQWVQNNFAAATNFSQKMVLFVPLKCEKYYHKNQMDLLNQKIKMAYSTAFNFFQDNKQTYEVAITPILTCGAEDSGVEFSRFQRDINGDIDLDPHWKTPKKAIYIFTKKMPTPQPIHCEQPMVYVLAYILTMLARQRQQSRGPLGDFWDWLQTTFGNFAAADDFLRELNIIKRKMKMNGKGYEIICNPLGF